ncbi:MAG: ATP-binding cassette domain-containing protein [Alphaproteobacteria bacterium]|nr:ATP-binding cassette domain-containing protein [Alphaproteobacteria bacterium]
MSECFLRLERVSKRFEPRLSLGDRIAARLGATVETRSVHAVDEVSLAVARGETLGLVGESGCGKSTLGRIAAGIIAPSQGEVTLDGEPVMSEGRKRSTRIQMVFQDPFASLDPRMRVGEIIAEGPLYHGLVPAVGARSYVARWMERVGLHAEQAERFPHQFSGGQRQRIAVARALAMQPDVLVCDEPVASLDVSIQAQIINLFLELRRDLAITCIFISHDLSVVRHLADRIAVMYLGRIVEIGPRDVLYEQPEHPYARALLDSVPRLVTRTGTRVEFRTIAGEIPSPLEPPAGCRFNPRCPFASADCRIRPPGLMARHVGGGEVACYHPLGEDGQPLRECVG